MRRQGNPLRLDLLRNWALLLVFLFLLLPAFLRWSESKWGNAQVQPVVETRVIGPPSQEMLASAQGIRLPPVSTYGKSTSTAERPTFGVRLQLEYAGKPFRLDSLATVAIKLADAQEFKIHRLECEVGSGEYLLPNLPPGTFSYEVTVDAEPANPVGFPGDFQAQGMFSRSIENFDPVILPLVRLLHIREPVDNGCYREGGILATEEFRISWDPIPEVDEYWVTMGVRPNGWPQTKVRTRETQLTMTLAPNFYRLQVEGKRDKKMIAVGLYHIQTQVLPAYGEPEVRSQRGFLPIDISSSATETQDVSHVFWYNGKIAVIPATAALDVRVFPKFSEIPIEAVIDRSPASFTIRGLKPGPYRMEVRIDLNGANPPDLPGDLYGVRDFTAPPEMKGWSLIFLHQNMRLLYPEDTADQAVHDRIAAGTFPHVKPPVVISWESLGEGVLYRYSLNPPFVHGTTTGTTLLINYSNANVSRLRLEAYSSAAALIGKLRLNRGDDLFPIVAETPAEALQSEGIGSKR